MLTKNLFNFSDISPYLQLLVGFSGGLDSTALLYQLVKLRHIYPNLLIRAVHINHGLSINANQWENHCKHITNSWKVPLKTVSVQIKDKGNIEANARKKRYTVFKKHLLPNEVLVTGHHLNDQCETFILSLKRGSGPRGLSSMRKISDFYSTKFIRPMLYIPHKDILSWSYQNNLEWITDESNKNAQYDRNFLRSDILPILIKRWPRFLFSVARSADICANQERLLDHFLLKELRKNLTKDGALQISSLKKSCHEKRLALIRKWLLLLQKEVIPNKNQVNIVWLEVAMARKDAKPCLKIGDYLIKRQNNLLRATKITVKNT